MVKGISTISPAVLSTNNFEWAFTPYQRGAEILFEGTYEQTGQSGEPAVGVVASVLRLHPTSWATLQTEEHVLDDTTGASVLSGVYKDTIAISDSFPITVDSAGWYLLQTRIKYDTAGIPADEKADIWANKTFTCLEAYKDETALTYTEWNTVQVARGQIGDTSFVVEGTYGVDSLVSVLVSLQEYGASGWEVRSTQHSEYEYHSLTPIGIKSGHINQEVVIPHGTALTSELLDTSFYVLRSEAVYKTDSSNYSAIYNVYINIVDTVTPESIAIIPDTVFVNVGEHDTVAYAIAPENAFDQGTSWISLDPSIASVATLADGRGAAAGLVEGETRFVVTTTNDHSDTVIVVVKDLTVKGVLLDITTLNLTVGQTSCITATVYPDFADNKMVSWSSDDEFTAYVTSDGCISAVGSGTATITVTTNDGGYTADCVVLVASDPPTSVYLNETNIRLPIGASETLRATVLPSYTDNKNVTWRSSDEFVATVNSEGKVTAVGEGIATITVETVVGGLTDMCSVTVGGAAPVEGIQLSDVSVNLIPGATKKLVATITPDYATDKRVTWVSSNTGVATVDSTGLVTAIAGGSSTIIVTSVDGNKQVLCIVTVEDESNISFSSLQDVSLFPNPATTELNVKGLRAGNATVSIINLTGVELVSEQVQVSGENTINSISIESIPPGTYILVIQNQENRYVRKFNKL